jgi:hypothetical protein
MTADQRGRRKGGSPALSLLIGICCLCVLAALISCSNGFSRQESLVNDLFEAARNQDVGKASQLMPRMSQLTPAQQKTALENLSRIGAYKITSSRRDGETVLVTLQYSLGSDVVSMTIPVRKEGESWIVGDDFRIRRSLQGQTFERSAP